MTHRQTDERTDASAMAETREELSRVKCTLRVRLCFPRWQQRRAGVVVRWRTSGPTGCQRRQVDRHQERRQCTVYCNSEQRQHRQPEPDAHQTVLRRSVCITCFSGLYRTDDPTIQQLVEDANDNLFTKNYILIIGSTHSTICCPMRQTIIRILWSRRHNLELSRKTSYDDCNYSQECCIRVVIKY